MKAIVYTDYGPPDVLQLKKVAKPIPKDHEVLIKVHAASVNSWDWDQLIGTFQGRLGGLFRPRNQILGADIAGRVEVVGKDVTIFKSGDDVFGDLSGCGWGGFAEYVCAAENALVMKPAAMSFEQAAAIPQAGLLALQGLRDTGKIRQGQKVLINGAGGGVGSFAIQIAKMHGAQVTGVDSAEKQETMRGFGADHVIDYRRDDYTKSAQTYDLILDVVVTRPMRDYRRALSPNGIFVFVGGNTARIFQLLFMWPWHAMTGSKKLVILAHKPNTDDLEYMKKLIEDGKIELVIDKCYPLEDTAKAIAYLGEGHAKGKVVITMTHGDGN
ncbi:MAG: NAD(P)-dependent alcohol dehydrogenase [Paracoccaceae bacterium]